LRETAKRTLLQKNRRKGGRPTFHAAQDIVRERQEKKEREGVSFFLWGGKLRKKRWSEIGGNPKRYESPILIKENEVSKRRERKSLLRRQRHLRTR